MSEEQIMSSGTTNVRRMGSVTHTGVSIPEIRPENTATATTMASPHIPETSASSTQKLKKDVDLVESQVRMLNEMLTEFGDPQHNVTEDDIQKVIEKKIE